MPHVLILHSVADYATWKTVFDQAAALRKAAGEISYQLLRLERDADTVVHLSTWPSLERARCFFESEELVALRARAGVKAPEFLYLEEIERGVL